jgi:HEAT repeat protein/uncharacterized membrane protein YraQ (UPF0718 family)
MKKLACLLMTIFAFVMPLYAIASQQESPESLIKQLNSDNPQLQEEAAIKLITLKDNRFTKDLIVILKTGNILARELSVKVLLELQDPRSIDSLRDALGDKDKIVVSFAKAAIQSFGPQAKESLKAGIKSGDWNIRIASAELLTKLGDRSGVEILLEGIKRGGHDQTESLHLLSNLNEKRALDPLIGNLINKDRKTRKKAVDILKKWIDKYPDIMPDVLSALKKTDNPDLKIEIMSSLAREDTREMRQEVGRLVQDADVRVRLVAVETLGFSRNKENIPVLMNALRNDKDEKVKKYAAVALSGMKVKEAVKPLLAFLREAKETDPYIINALANYGRELTPELISFLKDKNKNVRRAGAQVLGVINAVNAVDKLIPVLKDPDSDVRAAAAQALGKIQDKRSIPPLINTLEDENFNVQQEVVFALVSLGNMTIAHLNNMWKSGDQKERQRVVYLLAKLGDEKSISIMKEALEDADVQIRIQAAQGLAAFGVKGASLLLKALNDPDMNVRKAAVHSLGEIKDPKTVKALLPLLNSDLKEEVLQVLISIGSEDSLPVILSLVKDKNARLRSSAAAALGEIGNKKATQPLIALLMDKDVDVRLAAAEALGKLQDTAASKQLITLLSSGDIRMRRAAARALGTAGDNDAVAPLLKVLSEEDVELRGDALLSINYISQRTGIVVQATEEQIKIIMSFLRSSDETVRMQSGAVLVRIGKQAVGPLMELAKSGDIMARKAAIYVLGDIGDQRSAQLILDLLDNEKQPDIEMATVVSLGKLRYAGAVTSLIKKLKSEDWRIRSSAAISLGRIRDNRAVGALVKLMNDDNEKVRKSASEALEMITGQKCPVLSTLTTYTWIDKVIFVIVIAVLVIPMLRKYIKPFDRGMQKISGSFSFFSKERTQWWLAVIFGIIAIGYFTYCTVYRLSAPSIEESSSEFITNVSLFTLKIFPFFVGGCLISGIAMKFFSKRNVLPKSMMGTSALGALLPLCSCGVVPMTRAMLSLDVPRRAVIAFLVVTPILNPFVIFFSYGVIGLKYTVLRIVSVFLLAFVSGLMIERLVRSEEVDAGSPICRLCSSCVSSATGDISSSGMITGWRLMLYLGHYIAIGIIIGAVIGTYLPTIMVTKYLGSNIMGLFLASTIGVPLFICSGEDVVLLKPLLDLGLPMGHAIAFTIAGNGICASSIAILLGVLGRRTTALLTMFFWIGSFLIGYLINIFF